MAKSVIGAEHALPHVHYGPINGAPASVLRPPEIPLVGRKDAWFQGVGFRICGCRVLYTGGRPQRRLVSGFQGLGSAVTVSEFSVCGLHFGDGGCGMGDKELGIRGKRFAAYGARLWGWGIRVGKCRPGRRLSCQSAPGSPRLNPR